ncbi:hypothetical protein WJX74_008760 [Apatococcus lobatus]|uniref:DNA replication licensing factor MCM2 n=2 Tax=Apatococcus TaxID=904362 RepID=A0AAW1SXJ7_9CHLO
MDHGQLPDEGPPERDDSREFSDADDGEPEVQGSEDEGENLEDNAARDYERIEELDRYEEEGLDTEDQPEVSLSEQLRGRRAAERVLHWRDAAEGRLTGRSRARLPGALLAGESEEEDDEEAARPRRRQRMERSQAAQDQQEQEPLLRAEDQGGRTVRAYLSEQATQNAIKAQFTRFLREFEDEHGETVYVGRIKDMITANHQSLEVEYTHLGKWPGWDFATYVQREPKTMLGIFHEVAQEVAKEQCPDLFLTNELMEIRMDIFVRITNCDVLSESIRDVRQVHLDQLIKLAGVVTRRTGVFPQLQEVKFNCVKCGYVMGPFYQNTEKETAPNTCAQCQSKGPFEVNTMLTIYRNYQKIVLQETPGSGPAGRLPRSIEVILLNDLIDIAKPGEAVEVTGIYTHSYDAGLNARNGFPVFSTLFEANHVSKKEEQFAAYKLTQEDKMEILELAKRPDLASLIFHSIAPSIHGHLNIKRGIALALFGGQEKHPSGSHRLRGDINMLLLGDPGTAKSQFLKYTEKIAKRAVYTTGKGASAVGLTAAVQKDPLTREWTLEGGALVLADRGVCLIDELDKMNDQDRVSIHEAMEQQSISISKAGIVTQLQARCSVIAAANPDGGRYDSSRTFAENVKLSDPILSRFDILCVVKDVVDPILDERLARFVIGSHERSHPDADAAVMGENAAAAATFAGGPPPQTISQDLLRKYITYAKDNCRPRLSSADFDKLATVYTRLRQESALSHGMPIAVRHLESMIRMSEAHATMRLSSYVSSDDIDVAVRCLLESFISTQKQGVQRSLAKRLRVFMRQPSDDEQLQMHTLQGLFKEAVYTDASQQRHRVEAQRRAGAAADAEEPAQDPYVTISCRLLADRVREIEAHPENLQAFYQSSTFKNAGFELDQDRDVVRHLR